MIHSFNLSSFSPLAHVGTLLGDCQICFLTSYQAQIQELSERSYSAEKQVLSSLLILLSAGFA